MKNLRDPLQQHNRNKSLLGAIIAPNVRQLVIDNSLHQRAPVLTPVIQANKTISCCANLHTTDLLLRNPLNRQTQDFP